MGERFPPSGDPKHDSPPIPPPPSAAHLETYVVQIPRDQIYRIPPPEHARIVESHNLNSSNKKKTSYRSTCCWTTIPVVLLCIIAAIAILAVRATLYSPTPPEFSVTRFQGKNLENLSEGNKRRPPEYDITLLADNQNPRMSVTYQKGGEALLFFKNQKMGKGRMVPSTIKEEPNGNGGAIPLVLSGNGVPLSKEIKKSLNGTTEKSMVLKIEATMEMNSWVRNERRDLKIYCDFKVKNSLMSKTKISFQECRTEFQPQ